MIDTFAVKMSAQKGGEKFRQKRGEHEILRQKSTRFLQNRTTSILTNLNYQGRKTEREVKVAEQIPKKSSMSPISTTEKRGKHIEDFPHGRLL